MGERAFSAKKAFDVAKLAAEGFHSVMAKGCVEAQKEITQLNLLYRVATDAKRPYEERRNAVQKLQEVYPAYFGNLSTEQIMVGAHSTSTMTSALRSLRRPRRALRRMPSRKTRSSSPCFRQTGDAYDRYRKALTDVADAKEVQGCRQAVRNVPYDRWPDRNDARTDCARQC